MRCVFAAFTRRADHLLMPFDQATLPPSFVKDAKHEENQKRHTDNNTIHFLPLSFDGSSQNQTLSIYLSSTLSKFIPVFV